MQTKGTKSVSVNTSSHRLAGGLLLCLFLAVLALTQFESLHLWFHPDAKQPNHHCAVVTLSGGQVDAPPPCAVTAAVPTVVAVMESPYPPAVFPSFDFILLPSCGPPALLS